MPVLMWWRHEWQYHCGGRPVLMLGYGTSNGSTNLGAGQWYGAPNSSTNVNVGVYWYQASDQSCGKMKVLRKLMPIW
eukprot:1732359-Rhodomonas_salina.3